MKRIKLIIGKTRNPKVVYIDPMFTDWFIAARKTGTTTFHLKTDSENSLTYEAKQLSEQLGIHVTASHTHMFFNLGDLENHGEFLKIETE